MDAVRFADASSQILISAADDGLCKVRKNDLWLRCTTGYLKTTKIYDHTKKFS